LATPQQLTCRREAPFNLDHFEMQWLIRTKFMTKCVQRLTAVYTLYMSAIFILISPVYFCSKTDPNINYIREWRENIKDM